jgi:hypothetical protein
MTDSITRFAQKHRLHAAAALVQIIRDEDASPQARAAAAERILAYSDGRPGAPRPVTVADLDLMSPEERRALWLALFTSYEEDMPGQVRELMTAAYVEALQRVASPRPNRFQRGDSASPKQIGFTRGAPPPAQPNTRLPEPSSLKVGGSSYPNSGHSPFAHRELLQAPAGDIKEARVSQNCDTELEVCGNQQTEPLPFGLKFGMADDLPTNTTPVNGHNSIHPDVVRRSAQSGMAMDSLTWRDYRK